MAEEEVIAKLKGLSPKERIKKLKELQEKDKAEIEKAQRMISESEEQAAMEEETERMPIPQLRAVNIEELFSPEEKELFAAKRFVGKKIKEEAVRERPKKAKQLEDFAAEAPKLAEEEERAHVEYLAQLSQRPAAELKERVSEIYSTVKDNGYMSADQQQELKNIDYATRRKLDDIEAGKYTDVSREVADAMVLTERMKNWLQDSYGRHR